MKKLFYIAIAVVCSVGFIGMVNAEETWNSENNEFVKSLITGSDLTSDTAAKDFLSKYDVYYRYQKIDDTVYNNYLTDSFGNTNIGAKDEIAGLVPTVNETTEITSDDSIWVQVPASKIKITIEDLAYNEASPTGYLVAVAAIDKKDSTKVQIYRGVYEVSSTNTLVDINEIHYSGEFDTTDEDTYATESEDVATNKNPDTGLSDWAIYLVPLALISGSALMFRRRNA